MKKFRIALLCAAISVGVISAYASTAFDPPCASSHQYYWDYSINWYVLIQGVYGQDYTCQGDIGYCTYYRPNPAVSPNWYLPCRIGDYTPIY